MRTRSLLACLLLVVAGSSAVEAQNWKTTSSGREYNGEKLLSVDVEYAAGQLRLEPAAKSVLYRASIRYDADAFDPSIRYAADRLKVSIGEGRVRRNVKGGDLKLQLSPQVPLALELAFGAAEAHLELGGLRVRELSVETGASATTLTVSQPNAEVCQSASFDVGAARFEATGLGNLNARSLEVNGGVGEVVLDFTGQWRNSMQAEINMGLGSLTLRVPRGIGVQVRKDGMLAGFDSEGLVKRGNVYQSEGYERATHRLVVNLDAALGSIKVQWTN